MFKQVVERIFSNWTALKLAVEHSMGGPNSKQLAIDTINYIVHYCISEPNIDAEDIEDALDDIMDEEFNMFCEDDSIREVSQLVYSFLQVLKAGNMAQLEQEYNNLPPHNTSWLTNTETVKEPKIVEITPSTSCELMDQDLPANSEWTQVKSRKKR